MLKYLIFLTMLLNSCTDYKKVKLYESDPVRIRVVHGEESIGCRSTKFYNYRCMSMSDSLYLLDQCQKPWWKKLW